MKKNICCILSSLILICVLYICLSSSVEIERINIFDDVKFVDSEVLLASIIVNENVDSLEEDLEEPVEEEAELITEDIAVSEESEEEVYEVVVEEKKEVKVETDVLENVSSNEVITGKMTGYGPDCYGCSGYLAYGMYVGDGTIYYNDSEYGKVRIVAGDKKYKFGTIVKINGSMLAIVLDRGGSIGIGKKFLFDLLYESEAVASNHGVMTDVKFEILRNGF